AHVDSLMARLGKVLAQAVGLIEGERELPGRNLEADVAKVPDRSEAMVGNLIDVEGELRPDMLLLALGVVHDIAVAPLQLWKLHRHGNVGSLRVADGVADVVRKRADGEGEFVRVAGIPEQVDDEIAGTHVRGEIGEVLVAERIVANVLDDAAAVGVGAGVVKLDRRKRGVAAEQQWNDRCIPGQIDELLMREDRVAMSRRSKPGKTDKQRKSDVQAETHSRVMLESCGRVPGNRSWSADSGQRSPDSGHRSRLSARFRSSTVA